MFPFFKSPRPITKIMRPEISSIVGKKVTKKEIGARSIATVAVFGSAFIGSSYKKAEATGYLSTSSTVRIDSPTVVVQPPTYGPLPPTAEQLILQAGQEFRIGLENARNNLDQEKLAEEKTEQEEKEEALKSNEEPTVTAQRVPIAFATEWSSSVQPCGGDYPPCWVAERESHGDYTAVNPTGCDGRTCGGKWQFDPLTWGGFGGYEFAQDAPPQLQDEKAKELWNGGKGCGHWAACE